MGSRTHQCARQQRYRGADSGAGGQGLPFAHPRRTIEPVAVSVRLLPYLLLSGYLAWRPNVMFRSSTLAIVLLAVALYVGIVFGSTLYLHREFLPA